MYRKDNRTLLNRAKKEVLFCKVNRRKILDRKSLLVFEFKFSGNLFGNLTYETLCDNIAMKELKSIFNEYIKAWEIISVGAYILNSFVCSLYVLLLH